MNDNGVRDWYIVVGQQGRANFERALQLKTWGAKTRTKFEDEAHTAIKPGDRVHFVLTPKWSGAGPVPTGFPRIGLDQYIVRADEVVVRVTEAIFEDTQPIWDDDVYPVRFRFEIEARHDAVRFSPGLIPDTVRDAVRRSLIAQGRAISVESAGSLRQAIEEVLSRYSEATRQPFSHHPVADTIRETIPEMLSSWIDPNRYTVLASVGRGNWASVPWVAILDLNRGGNIQSGLYIAMLFSADLSEVVLALMFGVTGGRGEAPRRVRQSLASQVQRVRRGLRIGGQTWRMDSDVQLSDRGVGAQYGRGIVLYQRFSRETLPTDNQWRALLNEIVDLYDRAFDVLNADNTLSAEEAPSAYGKAPFDLMAATEEMNKLGYRINPAALLNVLLSLQVRPFVIFSGRSGTGKTTLTRMAAQLFGWPYYRVAVSPAWADPADLLGYISPVSHQRVAGGLDALLVSGNDEALLCLDEFNVAKVEHYFSDFISAMDSGHGSAFWGPMPGLERLASDSQEILMCPPNLRVMATMNFDDSVQSITPRVLDRANVIEFDIVEEDQLVVDHGLDWTALEHMARFAWPWTEAADRETDEAAEENIRHIWRALKGSRGQFGHRVAHEMARYVALGISYGDVLSWSTSQSREVLLDNQIVQRLLPKFHGTASHGDIVALTRLLSQLLDRGDVGEDVDRQVLLQDAINRGVFPRTVGKISRLFETYTEDGYASYF
ncbi:MrcB family domain-containing protein [Sulfobacillus harzensis]|uniref:DUF3578 domain-containing protein n=1 Tax=Sulfobacillus harzensis TaxID=2729629 RepID=A0A7Y0L679_9FIRM|nr:DUF3578 domain-containing protein [Sulfobacillus harzensis]NMP23773.1 DUF3578 domain-containing protein [Sulfobacillus harzensis]